MPTPDASAYTRQSKLRAFQNQVRTDTKLPTHLYQPVIKSSALQDFLPSFMNKVMTPVTFMRVNTTQRPPKTGLTGVRTPYIR